MRNFFNAIPADERPHFGTELEIAQIVVNPVAPPSAVQKVIDLLNDIKKDVEENGMSFATKAILYSQDRATGGQLLTFNRNSAFDKALLLSPYVRGKYLSLLNRVLVGTSYKWTRLEEKR